MEGISAQDTTSLSTYLKVLKRRGWIVALCAIAAAAVAYVLGAQQTPQYRSSADVLMNKQNLAANLTGLDSAVFFDEVRAADTQATLAAVPDVAERALREAKVTDRSPGDLLNQTAIFTRGDTDILQFEVTDSSPEMSKLLATSYARAFTKYRADLETSAIVKARAEIQRALDQLESQGRQRSSLYENLAEKTQQLQTLQTLQTSRTQVIRTAGYGYKIGTHPSKYGMIGLVLGLTLGLGLAFGAEALDTRIRTTGELSESLGGLALLSRIPTPPRKLQKADELVMVSQPTGPAAEAFRVLRTNLEFVRLSAGDVKSILVTSAVEQEGKSTTAANLAIALARSGKQVVLVDLDLRRPYIDRFFKLLHVQGLTDVALGHATLERGARADRPQPRPGRRVVRRAAGHGGGRRRAGVARRARVGSAAARSGRVRGLARR